MLCFPDCKINLGLYVTERRTDGYHNLETVFYPLPWQDVLEIVPAEHTRMHPHGRPVNGSSENNLVFKALMLLQEQYPGQIPPLDIHLLKNIPMGAGLGGGSSNGAYMLNLLNDYCALGLSQKVLTALALQLGSDCPFFIYDTPQFAKGRGEQMQPVSIDLSAYSIQVLCPGVHVSTAEAFKLITPKPASFDLREISSLPVTEWRQYIANDFERPVFQQHPEIADLKDALYQQGAIYASMTGSGSAVYGIFEKGHKAEINTPADIFYT